MQVRYVSLTDDFGPRVFYLLRWFEKVTHMPASSDYLSPVRESFRMAAEHLQLDSVAVQHKNSALLALSHLCVAVCIGMGITYRGR